MIWDRQECPVPDASKRARRPSLHRHWRARSGYTRAQISFMQLQKNCHHRFTQKWRSLSNSCLFFPGQNV